MRKLLLCVLLFCSTAGLAERLIVVPKAGLPEQAMNQMLGSKAEKIGQSNLYIAEGNAARLKHNPHFKSVEQDQKVSPALLPNDPYYGSAWHLPKIGAPSAWDRSWGYGVTIAILDSGVDSTHPDLATELVPGWNFYDNNSNTSDVYGHGTKAAGAAAAAGNNGVGVTGIALHSKIMPLRVTDLNGSGYYSMIAQGIIYAADNGAKVANASFLGLTGSSSIQNAAQYMKSKGGLVVVSGGNTGVQQSYPNVSSIISVAATDANDYRASWSSYGDYITVAAPGVGIWTTTKGGGYGGASGTSFSSPVTAGVLGLMMALAPALPNTQIESILFSTAVDLPPAGKDIYFGHGRIDAASALQAVAAAKESVDTQAPSIAITSPASGATVSGLIPVNVSATDNVGVDRVELKVNSTMVAVDSFTPFGFSWDSTGQPNGVASLTAIAYDAAGNSKVSSSVSVNISNGTVVVPGDTTPPLVKIINPVAGSISGKNVAVSVNASDDSGASGIRLSIYIDGSLKASGTGGTLGYNWNIRGRGSEGTHVVKAVATDAAGNSSTASVTVTK